MVEVREFVSDLLSGKGEHTPGVKDKNENHSSVVVKVVRE